MLDITRPYLEAAEQIAKHGEVAPALEQLRRLSLDDFGLFIISLPNPAYPALSQLLPRMASAEIQKTWTGSSGFDLLKQTVAFARILETASVRYTGKALQGATILDFGCGYGRILRMMYFYSDPDKIWGVDAWDKSISKSRADNVLGHLAQSERVPSSLPVGDTKFDFAFAFSVFTHLSPAAANACLSAVRAHMKPGSLFIPTIRPVEFWAYIDGIRKTNDSDALTKQHHKSGVAYLPHNGEEGKTYGDISLKPEFFEQPGWEVLGYDRSLFDGYQVSIILRAV